MFLKGPPASQLGTEICVKNVEICVVDGIALCKVEILIQLKFLQISFAHIFLFNSLRLSDAYMHQ